MSNAKICFELQTVRLALSQIMPVRQVKDPQKRAIRYRAIVASIKEVGLVEPLMVHPQKGNPENFLLMDGHLRFYALKELGETAADCILTSEDESFTFN